MIQTVSRRGGFGRPGDITAAVLRVWAHGGPERVGYGDLFGDRRIWLCETEGGKSNNKANILYVPSSPSHTAANAMEGEPPGAVAYATSGVDASGIKEDRTSVT